MKVEPGTRVKIAFTATYPDGELFDTSSQEVAVEYDVDADNRFRPIVLEVGAEPPSRHFRRGCSAWRSVRRSVSRCHTRTFR